MDNRAKTSPHSDTGVSPVEQGRDAHATKGGLRPPWLALSVLLALSGFVAAAPAAVAADPAAEPGKDFVYKQSAGAPQHVEVYYPPNWKP